LNLLIRKELNSLQNRMTDLLAARRDLELDEDPSLGLTLGDFDQKIQNRRLH